MKTKASYSFAKLPGRDHRRHGFAGDRRGERRGRSQVHPHGRPHILVDGSGRTQWYLDRAGYRRGDKGRSEEHTSELQSLMRISYAVFCLKKKKIKKSLHYTNNALEAQTQHHTKTDTR